jgi:hypothetical protein
VGNELEGTGWHNLKYYPSIYLEGLMKAMKPLNHDSRTSGRELTPGLPEYKARMIPYKPVRPVDETLIRVVHIFTQHVSECFNNIISNKDSIKRSTTRSSWPCFTKA